MTQIQISKRTPTDSEALSVGFTRAARVKSERRFAALDRLRKIGAPENFSGRGDWERVNDDALLALDDVLREEQVRFNAIVGFEDCDEAWISGERSPAVRSWHFRSARPTGVGAADVWEITLEAHRKGEENGPRTKWECYLARD